MLKLELSALQVQATNVYVKDVAPDRELVVLKSHTDVQVHIFSAKVLQLRVTITPDSSTLFILIVNCFSVVNHPESVLLTLTKYVSFVS
jgi:hypothetical protein